jgi:hypothetical protein
MNSPRVVLNYGIGSLLINYVAIIVRVRLSSGSNVVLGSLIIE